MWSKTNNFEELLKVEDQLIDERRNRFYSGQQSEKIGFALSGGGIRSATFCLGIFQALAKHDRIKYIDYISTVSGGGYFGAFLGRLFTRDQVDQTNISGKLYTQAKPATLEEIAWLRENGRYLSPNGGGDLLLATSMMLRNWIATIVVMASFLLLLFTLTHFIELVYTPPEWDVFWVPVPEPKAYWWPSGLWFLPLTTLLFMTVPPGWAYWCVSKGEIATKLKNFKERLSHWEGLLWISPIVGLILATALAAGYGTFISTEDSTEHSPEIFLAVKIFLAVTVVTWVYLTVAMLIAKRNAKSADPDQINIYQDDRERHWLTSALKVGLVSSIALLVLFFLDCLAKSLYFNIQMNGFRGSFSYFSSAIIGASGTITMFIDRIAAWLTPKDREGKYTLPLTWLAWIAAVILIGTLVVSIDALSYALLWKFELPQPASDDRFPSTVKESYGWGLIIIIFSFSWIFGRNWSFLNRSSLHALYSSRLARAYLGASNPKRHSGDPSNTAVIDVIPDDDVSMYDYYDAMAAKGAPLHLINVTVNETIGGQSQVQQQDRKGFGLSIGPAGICLGHTGNGFKKGEGIYLKRKKNTNASDVCEEPAVPCDDLSLAQWTAISGAALSTGMGSQSSIGASLLAGYFNLRLGYWWDAGGWLKDGNRKTVLSWLATLFAWLFPAQSYLLNEYIDRFYGPAKDLWNISDGGHFENMGAYELIRRKVPIIYVVDAEADPDYVFGGLGNLVRKARVDFGAEIEFLTREELKQKFSAHSHSDLFGTCEDLRKAANGYSKACAAIARVKYPGSVESSTLIYIKAAIRGDEPKDIFNYHAANPDFPQQTTADQFFDEAQWESYRKLGTWIGGQVFTAVPPESAVRVQ
jgi:hypothetical protein